MIDWFSVFYFALLFIKGNIITPVCYLGIVQAGCFYAPMDLTMPASRLNQILSVVDSKVMLVSKENLELAKCVIFTYESPRINRTNESWYFAEMAPKRQKKKKISYESCVEFLKKRYDGYLFAGVGESVYNPFSVLNVFSANNAGLEKKQIINRELTKIHIYYKSIWILYFLFFYTIIG